MARWSEENQITANNNPYIYQAIMDAGTRIGEGGRSGTRQSSRSAGLLGICGEIHYGDGT